MSVPIIEVFHDAEQESYACRLTSCALPVELYGVILCDIARQVAKMYAQERGWDEGQLLGLILSQFDSERANPSSAVYVNKLDS